MRQEENALTNSDIEFIQKEDHVDNPELTYAVFIKLNGKLLWKGQYPRGYLQDFDVYKFEESIWRNTENESTWKANSKVLKIMANYKAKDSRST